MAEVIISREDLQYTLLPSRKDTELCNLLTTLGNYVKKIKERIQLAVWFVKIVIAE